MFSAGSVLATTFRIWLRNLPRFVLIAAICSLPVFGFYLSLRVESIKDFVQRHYYQPIWERHPALINLTGADWIADAMIYGAIAVCVVAQLRGERVGVFRGLGRALRRSVSLLGAGLLHHVVTMGVIGVVIMCIWSRGEWMWRGSTAIYGWAAWSALWVVLRSLLYVVFAIAVIERRGPLSTFARNFALAQGNRFKVLAIVLVLWVLATGTDYAVLQLMLRDMEAYSRNFEIYGYVRMLVELVFASLSATAIAVTYEQLREAKEGPTPEALDRVFA